MNKLKQSSFIFFTAGIGICLMVSGCAGSSYVFNGEPPVESLQDQSASPRPESDDFNIREYLIGASGRVPVREALDLRRTPRSLDVNSMDQVPASSWYTPRLGYDAISAQSIVSGSEKIGAPQLPLTLVKAKKEGNNPGFVAKDQKGNKYLIKLDSAEYPGLESAVNFVVNRLFWAFGYNVPEDYYLNLKRSDVILGSSANLTQEDLTGVFDRARTDDENRYPATASLFIEGEILGHIAQTGVRESNVHDRMPHEDMRILRALKVFCMLTHQTGIRSDNTLETYIGESPNGYTKHYLLDFGESLGVHGLGYYWMWDGFQHYFGWDELVLNYLGLGIQRKPWEKIEPTDPEISDYFEAEMFHPENWKEVYPFQPIRQSQPDDDYWAAKIISALDADAVSKLFDASGYSETAISDYLVKTLLERKAKMLDYFLYRVSPLESTGVQNGNLVIQDKGIEILGAQAGSMAYRISIFDEGSRKLQQQEVLSDHSASFSISVASFQQPYLRVEVTAIRNGQKAPRAAEFHLRSSGSQYRLAGVIH